MLTPISADQTGTIQKSSTTSATQSVSLKDGLSAVVTIITQQKDNVLLVPSRAIKNSTVQVVNGSTTETVKIQTVLTDGINIEVIIGLKAGDQAVISSSTSSTSAISNSGGVGLGGIRLP